MEDHDTLSGPELLPARVGVPDLTLIVDVATLWPEPQHCPDGVFYGDMTTGQIEGELARLARLCNGPQPTRPPTADESAAAMALHFSERLKCVNGPRQRQWDAMGGPFPNLSPNHRQSRCADEIIRAIYLRGQLRKQKDAVAVRAKKAGAEAARRVQGVVGAYPGHLQRFEADLAARMEGARRHMERMQDEQDAEAYRALRITLEAVWREACTAAASIGEPTPARPEVLDN